MIISDIRIRFIKRSDIKLKAVASIIIDNAFAVHDIKIIDIGGGNYAVSMPCRKTPDGEFRDIAHPINSETRQMISDQILRAFHAELSRQHNN